MGGVMRFEDAAVNGQTAQIAAVRRGRGEWEAPHEPKQTRGLCQTKCSRRL